ncbi:MAG: DMT family transporter [Infirmifilum sp.]
MLWSILAIAAALLFALAGVLYRKAVSGSNLHPLLASGLRAGPAFLVMLPVFVATGGTFYKSLEYYLIATTSALFAFFVGDSFFIYGLSKASVGLVYPVAYTFPIFVALFNFVLTGKRPSPILLLSALIMVVGIKLAYSGNNKINPVGLLSGFMASLSWGLGITLASLALKEGTPFELNFFRTGLLLATTTPIIVSKAEKLSNVKLRWLLLGGLLGIGLGPIALFYSIQLSGPVGPSVISSGAPVFAVLLAYPLLQEKPRKGVLSGAVLVALATAITALWG